MCIDSMIGFISSCFSCFESNEDIRVNVSSQRQATQATSAIAQEILSHAVTIHIQPRNTSFKAEQEPCCLAQKNKEISLKKPIYLILDSNLPSLDLGLDQNSLNNSSNPETTLSCKIFDATNLEQSEILSEGLTISSDDKEFSFFKKQKLINLLKLSNGKSFF